MYNTLDQYLGTLLYIMKNKFLNIKAKFTKNLGGTQEGSCYRRH